MTWRWHTVWAETCRQFNVTTSKNISCVLTHLKPSPYSIIKHNVDVSSMECILIFHCIQRRPQKNSSNETKNTNIPLYFLLQQQFVKDNTKTDLKFIYFSLSNIFSLLVLMSMTDVLFTLLQSWKKSQYTDPMWAGSSVGIATELRAGRCGVESLWGRDFPPFQTGPGAHTASYKLGTGSFPGINCCRVVLLNTHPLLVQRSLRSRAITLPTLWATLGL